jgi:hypothetical protein
LMGRWGGELDTFYEDLLIRVLTYKKENPGSDWSWIRTKPV